MNDLILKPESPQIPQQPNDQTFPVDRNDVTGLDEDHLKNYILELFENDIREKEEQSWVEKRTYDFKAYYGLKDEALKMRPWPNASAYPVPLTPTLLDTAWANINASMIPDNGDVVKVKGRGKEDVRLAPILARMLSDQVVNETNLLQIVDLNNFRAFLNGVGFQKILTDSVTNTIRFASIDIENMFVPVYAQGMQREDSDHLIQVVPLTWNDLQLRKLMGVYKYADSILPDVGRNIMTHETIERIRSRATSQGNMDSFRRKVFFLLECHLTYYPNTASSSTGKTSAGVRPKELIVTMSPNGGVIQRIREAKGKRPYAESIPYPNAGRFYGMSLPEKIRNIQEKMDYADKQNTDALDRAISPAMFVDSASTFDSNVAQRVPGGVYEKGAGKIDFEPTANVNNGFERQQIELWRQAQILTGIIDLFQGAQSESGRTLGEVNLRSVRAGVRFKSVLQRFDAGFGKLMNLLYDYDNQFMPREQMIKMIGYDDYKTVDELFPKTETGMGLGLEGQFDFSIGGTSVVEAEQEKIDKLNFAAAAMLNPLVKMNPANLWRVLEVQAEANGIRTLDSIVSKPKEVNIYTVEEFLQRIISGQTDLQLRPGIDTDTYVFELQVFKRTDTYAGLDNEQKMAIEKALQIANIMGVMERKAALDIEVIRHGAMGQQMAQNMNPALPAPVPQGAAA